VIRALRRHASTKSSLQGGIMVAQLTPSTRAAGFWSAVFATVFSLAYIVGQLAEWLGWLGSRGGPESSSTPLGIVVLLTPSLLLGPCFLVLVASVHQATIPEKRVWSQTALAFATAYTVLISMNYFVQLTLVAPRLARGDVHGIEMFLFVPFNSFLYAVDILGYCFMSVATLFVAIAMASHGRERAARSLLIANGLLLPFLAFQMYFHWLIWPAALWAITFPGSMWALALLFRRGGVQDSTVVAGAEFERLYGSLDRSGRVVRPVSQFRA